MNRDHIYEMISAERHRQTTKWAQPHDWGTGDCSSQHVHPLVKLAVLQEEAGEVARAVLDMEASDLRTELTQTAAVCVAWLESL